MAHIDKLFDTLWTGLTSRQKEVVVARFGLGNKKPQTLEAIGKTYGVTRERVRQIEAAGLVSLKKKIGESKELADLFGRGKKYLKEMGGVAEEQNFVRFHSSYADGMTREYLAVLVEAARPYYFYGQDEKYNSFYYLDKENLRKMQSFVGNFVKSLRERENAILEGGYDTHVASFLKRAGVSEKRLMYHLALSREIAANPYGDTGLAEWPTISPRTVRDKIYLVLKKEKRPVHFREIADLINKVGFQGKVALSPTVHNELIKDSRFVLVGRGMYGLSEHGFSPGVARDVIRNILKSQGPLRFPDIVSAVQKERFFKPNTVLANLQNKQFFERTDGGAYRVREE